MGAVAAKPAPTVADVLAVVEACPALPEAIKAGILAMVRAAGATADCQSAVDTA